MADEKPAEANPEAIEDAPAQTTAPPPQQFQNVDLEANNAAPQKPATTDATKNYSVTNAAMSLSWGAQNLMLAFFAITVMVSASTVCGGTVGPLSAKCSATAAYQVAVGCVSGFFALIFGGLSLIGKFEDPFMQEMVSLFQFLWWIPGVIVLTFFGTYTTTILANGYFGSWGAFFFAVLSLTTVSPRFQSSMDKVQVSPRRPLIYLAVASAVEMGAAIAPCNANCMNYPAWAITLGVVSLFMSLVLIFAAPTAQKAHLRYIAMFLIIWWVVGTGVVTFGSPFLSTGNGYFASFAAVFASVGFLQSVQE